MIVNIALIRYDIFYIILLNRSYKFKCIIILSISCIFKGTPKDMEPLDKTRDEDVVVPIIKRKKKQ